jgi:hypothetical protein
MRLLVLALVFGASLAPAHVRADAPAPFAFGDFTWVNGQSRQKDFPLAFNKAIALNVYVDAYYAFSLNRPYDDTITGSATLARHNELQLNLASIGAEWNWRHIIGRLSLQYGTMISIVQDQDRSVDRGTGISAADLRYIKEATLGYHWDVQSGVNLEAGIFLSYIGMESYLLAENWLYTRTLACDSTPFYFQGIRTQWFPTDKWKIEGWFMNGWQTYAKWSFEPSGGLSLRWSPWEWIAMVANFYVGADTPNEPDRVRFHHDDSVNVRVYNRPLSRRVSKVAFSINNHFGFQQGGIGPGITQAYMGATAAALRVWFHRDLWALTVRGEYFTNPSRYLVPFAPNNWGVVAPGNDFKMVGVTGNVELMPTDFFSVRAEVNYRHANVPFFAGSDGTTSASGFLPLSSTFVPNLKRDQVLFILAANFRL